jgi:putative FmdB family regulatory protein
VPFGVDLLGEASVMPIYEYRCRKCRKRFSVLTLRISERAVAECPKCGSRAADRLLSRFAMPKSEAARLDSLADPTALGDIDTDDPKSVGRWMRKMGREMGDELGGEDLDEMIDEVESGSPDGDDSDSL